MRIEVIRDSTPTARQRWSFMVFDSYSAGINARLDLWAAEERPSPRHRKWVRVGEGYVHRYHDGAIHVGGNRLRAADVPFPADVVEELRRRILEGLVITGPVDPTKR